MKAGTSALAMDRQHFTYNHPVNSGHRSIVGEIVVIIYIGVWPVKILQSTFPQRKRRFAQLQPVAYG